MFQTLEIVPNKRLKMKYVCVYNEKKKQNPYEYLKTDLYFSVLVIFDLLSFLGKYLVVFFVVF